MTDSGIYFEKLVKNVSLEEALALCHKQIRDMLAAVHPDEHELTTSQLTAMAIASIDIPSAVKDDNGIMVLLKLIQQHPGGIAQLVDFAGISPAQTDDLPSHLRKDPSKLVKFLRWNKNDSGLDKTESVVSSRINPLSARLRYYQLVDTRKLIGLLDNGGRALYHAPTGAGKTRTAMSVVTRHMLNHGPTRVLWLASTAELVEQAAQAFTGEWEVHGDTECMVYQWRGGGAKFAPARATNKNTMLVASLQLLNRRDEDLEQLKGDVSLIVFDEAHQSLAPTYRNIIDMLMESGTCSLLGLSATPARTESDEASKQLSELYNGNKLTIHHAPGTNPIRNLVKEGYLSEHKFHVLPISIAATPKPKPGSDDYNNQLLEWLGQNIERNLKIVDLVQENIEAGHLRILVFTPSLDSARFCTLALKEKHQIMASYVVAGDTPRDKRASILQRYGRSDADPVVIFNFGVLTTGFDAPKTSSVIIARPTKSKTLYTQMAGRALRGKQSGGTSQAAIYTVADSSLVEFADLAEIFVSFDKDWS